MGPGAFVHDAKNEKKLRLTIAFGFFRKRGLVENKLANFSGLIIFAKADR